MKSELKVNIKKGFSWNAVIKIEKQNNKVIYQTKNATEKIIITLYLNDKNNLILAFHDSIKNLFDTDPIIIESFFDKQIYLNFELKVKKKFFFLIIFHHQYILTTN
ncbi:MAG: hypothetical protein GY830_01425 [Bacteroidetes bacterium]|nr:hypothetical protein [Bacteroidota bacterium]